MTQRTQTAMQALLDLGQSVWLDYLRRGMLRSGELQGLIDDGLRGMTSNPTIFEHAIGGSSDYDDELRALATSPASDREVFERLAVEDVRQAADLLPPGVRRERRRATASCRSRSRPRWRATPTGTIAEARRLWAAVDRPNLMIKVPGTKEGWPAVERLLTEGINVNITLLFSLEHYRQVAEAYLRALEARVARGPADRPAGLGGLVLREPGGHRGRPADRGQGRRAARPPGQGRRSPTRSWPTPGSASCWRARGGSGWPRRAPGRSGSSGPAPAPRTRPTPTCSTSTR